MRKIYFLFFISFIINLIFLSYVIAGNKAAEYLNEGIRLYDEGMYDEAIVSFNKAITLDPTLDEAFIGRGTIYGHKMMLDLAISDFNQALKIKNDSFKAYTGRGIIYLYKRNIDKAILDFSKAIELKPDHAAAYCSRAVAYVQKKEFEKASEDIKKAQSLGLQIPPELIESINKGLEK